MNTDLSKYAGISQEAIFPMLSYVNNICTKKKYKSTKSLYLHNNNNTFT